MEYISLTRLSHGKLRLHRNRHNMTSSVGSATSSQDLPLFEQLVNRDAFVAKLLEQYGTDMHLFGYKLSTDKSTGYLRTTCETYGSHGMCC